jgi:hypothetical protein
MGVMMKAAMAETGVVKFHPWIPLLLAALMMVMQLTVAGNYGYFADEMYLVDCSRHLDFGYIDHPPFSVLVAGLSTALFGTSILGLRLWPALAGGLTVLLAAAMARELGGGRFAQSLASMLIFAAIVLPALFNFFSMNAFDILLVTIAAWLLVKILKAPSPKLWLLFGLVAGIGLENKLTMLVFGFSAAVGLLLTSKRRLLASPWPWVAGLIALVIFSPYVVWQVLHGWPTLEFINLATNFRNPEMLPLEFFLQITLALNPLTVIFWVGGLVYLLLGKDTAAFRALGAAFVVFIVVFMLNRAQVYYIAPIMPLVLAAGAVATERFIKRINWRWLKPVVAVYVSLSAIVLMPLAIPILPVEDFIAYSRSIGLLEKIKLYDMNNLPIHFGYRFGWEELTAQVEDAFLKLSPSEKQRCTIMANGYAKTAALNFLGPAKGLPRAVSGCLSCYYWGPGDPKNDVVILVGFGTDFADKYFADVKLISIFTHPYIMPWETNQPIFICKKPYRPLAEVWGDFKGL